MRMLLGAASTPARALQGLTVLALTLLLAGPASATSFVLGDQNATAVVNTEESDPDGSGMLSWQVDGTEQLFEQWFYLQAGDGDYQRIDTYGLVGEQGSDTNAFVDDRLDTVAVRYGGSDLTIDLTLTLRGAAPGSGAADVAETVVITNTAQEAISISLVQYVDLDLGFDSLADVVELVDGHTVRQVDTAGTSIFEEVVTPGADVIQLALFPDVADLLDAGLGLEDARDPAGPDDVAFGLQWDVLLDPGKSFVLSKDKRLEGVSSVPVPAPAVMPLLLAAGAFALRRQR